MRDVQIISLASVNMLWAIWFCIIRPYKKNIENILGILFELPLGLAFAFMIPLLPNYKFMDYSQLYLYFGTGILIFWAIILGTFVAMISYYVFKGVRTFISIFKEGKENTKINKVRVNLILIIFRVK